MRCAAGTSRAVGAGRPTGRVRRWQERVFLAGCAEREPAPCTARLLPKAQLPRERICFFFFFLWRAPLTPVRYRAQPATALAVLLLRCLRCLTQLRVRHLSLRSWWTTRVQHGRGACQLGVREIPATWCAGCMSCAVLMKSSGCVPAGRSLHGTMLRGTRGDPRGGKPQSRSQHNVAGTRCPCLFSLTIYPATNVMRLAVIKTLHSP